MLDEFETKRPWQSAGVWGGITAILAGLGGIYGYSVSPEDAANAPVLIASIFANIGGLLAIFGRVRASKRIK